jgi:hypothetical protein
MALWVSRAGMALWAFSALMGIFFAYSLAMARLVAAAGVYVPDASMSPRDLLVGVTGAAGYSPSSLTMMTYLQAMFMLEWKVSFLHFSMNDLKVLHAARLPGRLAAGALLAAVVLMLAIAPWANIHAAYTHGAQQFDPWEFQYMGNTQFGLLAASLQTPESARPYLPVGLLCGAAVMSALTWLHLSFLWWRVSPIGFIMGGTWALNQRIWASAFIAWLLVTVTIRAGGLRLYRSLRPAFLGMILGHCAIMGLRSLTDPLMGLHMSLLPWA